MYICIYVCIYTGNIQTIVFYEQGHCFLPTLQKKETPKHREILRFTTEKCLCCSTNKHQITQNISKRKNAMKGQSSISQLLLSYSTQSPQLNEVFIHPQSH